MSSPVSPTPTPTSTSTSSAASPVAAVPDAVDPDAIEGARQSVRKLMGGFGPDYWAQQDRSRAFPTAFFEAAGEAGFFGTLIPEAYGGAGAGVALASVVVEEVNRAGGDSAALNAQMSICGTVARSGNEAQRALLPAVARGEVKLLTVAATEPDSGTDMSALQSTAKRDGDTWVVDAKKVFISMAEHTDWMLLLVRAAEGPTLFLLKPGELGAAMEVRPVEMVTNRMTTMLYLDGARVPDSARVGEVGKGLECLMQGFVPRRILAAAECLGNARFLLDVSLPHARERVTFDRPIGQNQGVQYPLAQAYTKVEAADLMRWDAVAAAGRDDPGAGGRSAMAKVLASEAAWETARVAMATFGGWGLASEYHIERKLRDSTVYIFNNMLLSYISQRVLDLPKSF